MRLALNHIPNDGPFDDRDAWLRLAHAVKGACIAGGIEAEGREYFLEWSARWHGGGDPAHDAVAWDGISDTHTGWGTVMRLLETVSPSDRAEVKEAEARFAFATQTAATVTALSATAIQPAAAIVPGKIPPRQWLYGRALIRGFVSLLVAPGGAGKSALTMAEAVAMAAGRELLAGDKPHRALRVLYHNGEDGPDEQARRLEAALACHKVSHADLGGRLFLTSGRNLPIQLARLGDKGAPEVVPGVVEALVSMAREHSLDVIVLDPLGAVHGLPENSNDAINLLWGALRDIAEQAQVAICLVHHASKGAALDMSAAGAAASRGASALVDGARVVRQIQTMSEKEAASFRMPHSERRRYLRVDNGKANLAPAGGARWLRLVGVPLGNVTTDYPDGDDVQTVEHWTPPDATDVGLTDAQINDIHAALAGGTPDERRASPRSPGWAGYLIAETLSLDIDAYAMGAKNRTPDHVLARREAEAVIKSGLKSGWLIRSEEKGEDRKPHGCIASGTAPASSGAENE